MIEWFPSPRPSATLSPLRGARDLALRRRVADLFLVLNSNLELRTFFCATAAPAPPRTPPPAEDGCREIPGWSRNAAVGGRLAVPLSRLPPLPRAASARGPWR